MNLKEKLIILKTLKYKDFDLLVYGLSENGLFESYIAPYYFKSKKRFEGGVLEPTHYVEVLSLKKNHLSSLKKIKEAHLLNDFPGLRDDYSRLNLAFYFLNLVYKVSLLSPPCKKSFLLLGNAFKTLSNSCDLEKLKILFLMKFLHYHGLLPKDLFIFPHLLKDHQKLDSKIIQKKSLKTKLRILLEDYTQSKQI